MKKIFIILLVIGMLPVCVSAKMFGKVGTASMQFLKLGVDARAIGMGQAYTPVSDDISSTYWNPGGLAVKDEDQAIFSHTNWVADIMHEFFAVSKVTDMGTFAFSASVLHMDDMDETTYEAAGKTGRQFTCSSYAVGLTYSQAFTDKFSFGFTGKYLRENLEEYYVDNFSVDIGSQYNTLWRNLKIGMTLRNFDPDVKYEIDDDNDGKTDEDPFDLLDNDGDGRVDEDPEESESKIPMTFSFGLCADLYRDGNDYIIAALQVDNCVDRDEKFNLGAEWKISNFFLRSGYQFNYDAHGASFGFGLIIPTSFSIFNVDYAYTSMGKLEESFLESAHRWSIKMNF